MSLRAVHILFILTALGLLAFVAYWSGERVLGGQDGANTALLACASLGLLAGIPYLAWFIKKTKSL